ncbi:hypothetical protein ACVWWO_006366 [Bradyrhizobium sp. F1.13.1]
MKVFLGDTTFEREITTDGNLAMLETATRALGAPVSLEKYLTRTFWESTTS